MSRRRVVVTGLGCVTPVGNTVADSWTNLLAGKSGIDFITQFDAAAFTCKFAGEVKGFNIADYIPEKEARHMDRFIHLGLAAAIQAVQDSGLPTGDALKDEVAFRIGCNIGSGIGGLPLIENTHAELVARGPRRVSPFFVPASIINMISGHVSIKFGFKGPNVAVVTACTTEALSAWVRPPAPSDRSSWISWSEMPRPAAQDTSPAAEQMTFPIAPEMPT